MIFFITVFVIQMILLVVLLLLPTESQAADVKFQPQITIPGSSKFSAEKIKQCQTACESKKTKEEIAECKQGCGISVGTQVGDKIVSTLLGEYIRDIYKYAVGIVGILAAVVLMFGGVVWLTAGGNQTRIGEAKAWIGASLTGLIIVLTSYMILYTVNPDLVRFRPIEIRVVEEDKTSVTCTNLPEAQCKSAAGCKWAGNKCSDDTSPDVTAKCGLAQNEMTGSIHCCTDGSQYKYARIVLNKDCGEICGAGWYRIGSLSTCKPHIGY
jgi:hypothetical protein